MRLAVETIFVVLICDNGTLVYCCIVEGSALQCSVILGESVGESRL